MKITSVDIIRIVVEVTWNKTHKKFAKVPFSWYSISIPHKTCIKDHNSLLYLCLKTKTLSSCEWRLRDFGKISHENNE